MHYTDIVFAKDITPLLVQQTRELECVDLISMLDARYSYLMHLANTEHHMTHERAIKDLIDEIIDIEQLTINLKVERYDLAIICRDYRITVADEIAIEPMLV